jgi:arylsulfatase A-like enzyme
MRLSVRRFVRLSLLLCLFGVTPGPAAADERPSILLIVVDTLRAGAVSAYGEVKGTTPEMDSLAGKGLLYRNAHAPAPWTLPSHATLFSGLRVDQHRVGMPGRSRLPEAVLTLAEQLRAAGYETASFSENGVVSDDFQLLQGFDHRVTSGIQPDGRWVDIDASEEVTRWLESRESGPPLFVFVNLMDPHQPYEVRPENPFVPAGVSQSAIKTRPERPNRLSCGGLPDPTQMQVLYGLYLGDVRTADAKAGRIVRAMRAKGGVTQLISVATSDHGEYFGENKLMGHEFGLHGVVLNVPLIVHGLKDVKPGVVTDTVGLVDIAPSILAWAGVEPGAELPGRTLPLEPGTGEPSDRAIFAAYSDDPRSHWMPDEWKGENQTIDPIQIRQFCGASDPVWGGIAAIVQYPFKFHWFERYEPALYDLSWDPDEKFNQARFRPDLVKRFTERIEPHLRAAGLTGERSEDGKPVSEKAARALEALGYLE